MSSDKVRDTMKGYVEALTRLGDVGPYLAPDVTMTVMENGDTITGRDAVRDTVIAMHSQGVRGDIRVRNVLVDGDVAVLEAEFVGTHVGDFAGIPATGKTVHLPYTIVYEVGPQGITAVRGYASFTAVALHLQGAAGSVTDA